MSSNEEDTMTTSYPLKFLPFSSTVDSPFWVQYCHLKLETIRLDESPIPIVGTYGPGDASRLQLVEGSLSAVNDASDTPRVPNERVACHGNLLGLNTLESFGKKDKNELLKQNFCDSFFANTTTEDANIMKVSLLTFADLKQHKVLHWFGFPALMCKEPIATKYLAQPSTSIDKVLQALPGLYHDLRQSWLTENKAGLPPFFVATQDTIVALDLQTPRHPETMQAVQLLLTTENIQGGKVMFGFIDPSPPLTTTTGGTTPQQPPMGWPLRNLIAYLVLHLDLAGQEVPVVSWRAPLRRLDTQSPETMVLSEAEKTRMRSNLVVLQVTLPSSPQAYSYPSNNKKEPDTTTTSNDESEMDASTVKVVGWELNAKKVKPGPKWVNLKPLLDNTHLAIQAADLNLKLMKWRMIPQLDVARLQSLKVLLLGAGTLGCSVARTLLGWGVRDFTLVDYGTVSYSNPVRQNLFTLEDCHANAGAGKPKAAAAAASLEEIAADVKTRAIRLSIPMPGHAHDSKDGLSPTLTQLDTLVQEADVVYLLTDTRESRWLPTLLAAVHDKPMINAALGLDSWLVMRHGGFKSDSDLPRLGCYFCNDVVAPENSTKNRTLDQQCTVTRPGLAPIAASMAVELTVSLLHHTLQHHAPAPAATASSAYNPTAPSSSDSDANASSALGVMPHQIRGSLVSYQMMTPTVPAFGHCTGCAASLVEAYRKDPLGLVYQVCQSTDGRYLEDLTGLTAFRAEAANKLLDDDMDFDDW